MTAKQAHRGVDRWFLKEKIGITPLQLGILRSLSRDSFTLNDLARRMMFKPPSILPAVDLLEKNGFITRRNDPRDRRKIHLVATAKGRRILERVISSRKLDPLGSAFKRMTDRKKKQLVALLMELNDGISKK